MISKRNTIFTLLTFIIVTIGLFTIQNKFESYDNKFITRISYKIDKDKYLAAFTSNTINIFLENGKPFSQYELKKELIMSSTVADLDRDGKDEIILLTCKEAAQYGEDLLVLSFKDYTEDRDNIIFKEKYRNHCKYPCGQAIQIYGSKIYS